MPVARQLAGERANRLKTEALAPNADGFGRWLPAGALAQTVRSASVVLGGDKPEVEVHFECRGADAATALRDGLVSRVVAPADLARETLALANHIAAQPPGQIAEGKAMFHKHMEMDLTAAYDFASDFMVRAMQTEDARAGIDAFVNKKPKPDWTGR